MKIVVLLVLVAAAVSSAYAQCDSVEEKQMVSCAKNFMRRCDKATKKCLRERCASHTAECLVESCKYYSSALVHVHTCCNIDNMPH